MGLESVRGLEGEDKGLDLFAAGGGEAERTGFKEGGFAGPTHGAGIEAGRARIQRPGLVASRESEPGTGVQPLPGSGVGPTPQELRQQGGLLVEGIRRAEERTGAGGGQRRDCRGAPVQEDAKSIIDNCARLDGAREQHQAGGPGGAEQLVPGSGGARFTMTGDGHEDRIAGEPIGPDGGNRHGAGERRADGHLHGDLFHSRREQAPGDDGRRLVAQEDTRGRGGETAGALQRERLATAGRAGGREQAGSRTGGGGGPGCASIGADSDSERALAGWPEKFDAVVADIEDAGRLTTGSDAHLARVRPETSALDNCAGTGSDGAAREAGRDMGGRVFDALH